MLDTTIAAAYAAQYARKSGKEPTVGYFCSNIGDNPYTFLHLDDLSYWLSDNDSLKETIKDYGWELHTYADDKPSRLHTVPGHTPGGTRLVNKINYCGFIDFKDSKKATDVNIRNVAIAAKELVHRCQQCEAFIEQIQETFTKLPEHTDLASYVEAHELGKKNSWLDKVMDKYGYERQNVQDDMVIRALKVLDKLPQLTVVGRPFVQVDACYARHWVENVLRMCKDVQCDYLTADSFGVAASIYMEDRYDPSVLKDGLQLPQVFETLEYFDQYS